jgi:hypothetical protein
MWSERGKGKVRADRASDVKNCGTQDHTQVGGETSK